MQPARARSAGHERLGLRQDQQDQLFHLFRYLHQPVDGIGVVLYSAKKTLDLGSMFTAILPA
ncbi:hypothetical protein [Hymenobacter volaticus]|uniref:Uncharacterized protein n=1 Tax=Hymenobacter volaticus TaxID=2932254 RepID=A0ABY4GDY2_9BACT|nr:hypothetical protein [Hymenobacter volaticus]UOQ69130.1 hypothetical protein MUN86_25785 [Hymenobacter volaticus]